MICRRTFLVVILVAAASVSVFAQANGSAGAAAATIDQARLKRIDTVVNQGLAQGQMAGCVVLVGHRGEVQWLRAYGDRQVEPERIPMSVDTVFDLASLTKPLATATAILHLHQAEKLNLDDRASEYLPGFQGHDKETITLSQLLTHQSGLLPDNAMQDYRDGKTKAFERIDALDLRAPPGEKFIYSDVGFIVLARVVESVAGMDVDQYTRRHLYGPLGMRATGYLPDAALRARAAATEQRDGRWMRGEVHDPRAYALGGVAGHAGLFSTADDLFRYATMMINGGSLDGVEVLKPSTIDAMTRPIATSSGLRSHGWDIQSSYSSNRGDLLSDDAFGHGGFTGTAMWIDREQQLTVIFLSNRLHPDGKGSVNALAGRISTIAAAAVCR